MQAGLHLSEKTFVKQANKQTNNRKAVFMKSIFTIYWKYLRLLFHYMIWWWAFSDYYNQNLIVYSIFKFICNILMVLREKFEVGRVLWTLLINILKLWVQMSKFIILKVCFKKYQSWILNDSFSPLVLISEWRWIWATIKQGNLDYLYFFKMRKTTCRWPHTV